MEPEHVVIKAFRGIAINRWLVGVGADSAVITDESGATAVLVGREPEHSLGFPKGDIFVPPDTPVRDGDRPNWEEMRPRF
jgi:hypothetical protein